MKTTIINIVVISISSILLYIFLDSPIVASDDSLNTPWYVYISALVLMERLVSILYAPLEPFADKSCDILSKKTNDLLK
ncbi:MAG: hypothetical protein KAQ94_02750 [Arcobacteraceae bacterium]|nr:hypothetical protein [Arcobacteraceae bacterium]